MRQETPSWNHERNLCTTEQRKRRRTGRKEGNGVKGGGDANRIGKRKQGDISIPNYKIKPYNLISPEQIFKKNII